MQNRPMMQSGEVDSYTILHFLFGFYFAHMVRFSFDREMDCVKEKKNTASTTNIYTGFFFSLSLFGLSYKTLFIRHHRLYLEK